MDDAALRDEATRLTADLIRIDTTNPPGRETAAAVFLKEFLEREGVACELVAREPDRANLVARIPGTGDGPSLAFLGHTDVVLADADAWTHPPFSGHVADGWLWGRGALDMKSHTACNALAFALLARSGFRPRGDLVLIAEANEEEDAVDGGPGLEWLVRERPDLRTDYAINEGGGERLVLADGRVVYLFASAEKATMPVRVTVRGVAGHASTPDAGDNALPKLAPVLERLVAHRPKRSVQQELAALLDVVAPGNGDVDARLAAARAQHEILDLLVPPMLGSTMTPTMASASQKRNVIPARAEVVCDCRVLPGTEPEELFAEFRTALDGLDVDLELASKPEGGTRSPLGTPLEAACRDFIQRTDPGAEIVPAICVGFTDSHWIREAFGTVAYGFLPLRHTDPILVGELVHANDERVHQDDLVVATRFLEHLARTIGGPA